MWRWLFLRLTRLTLSKRLEFQPLRQVPRRPGSGLLPGPLPGKRAPGQRIQRGQQRSLHRVPFGFALGLGLGLGPVARGVPLFLGGDQLILVQLAIIRRRQPLGRVKFGGGIGGTARGKVCPRSQIRPRIDPRHLRQHPVKLPRIRRRRVIIGHRLVQPPQMRQQQPRVIAPPRGDLFAVIPDRLFHPVDRPVSQRIHRHFARQHLCRRPAPRKIHVPPPQFIGRSVAHPGQQTGPPHIPLFRQMRQEPHLAFGRPAVRTQEPVIPGSRRRRIYLPGTGRGTARRAVEGFRPLLLQLRQQPGRIPFPRNPHIPRQGHPPPPKPRPLRRV